MVYRDSTAHIRAKQTGIPPGFNSDLKETEIWGGFWKNSMSSRGLRSQKNRLLIAIKTEIWALYMQENVPVIVVTSNFRVVAWFGSYDENGAKKSLHGDPYSTTVGTFWVFDPYPYQWSNMGIEGNWSHPIQWKCVSRVTWGPRIQWKQRFFAWNALRAPKSNVDIPEMVLLT